MKTSGYNNWVFYIFIFAALMLMSSCQKREQISKIGSAEERKGGNEKRSDLQSQEDKGEKEWIPTSDLIMAEKAFVRAARSVIPAVVNISTVQTSKNALNNYSGGNKNLFDGLFNLFNAVPEVEHEEKSLGSGFIIKSDGYILTNNHVVADSDKIKVRLSDNREFEGNIIGKDAKTDLALLKISSAERLPVAILGNSSKLEVGEWAIAIGNPFGLDRTVTLGVISAKGRSNLGLTDYENYIQTDASINFGNSGGPLLNIKGEVVGINTAIISSGQGIGFAIPINRAKAITESLIFSGKLKKGWVGIIIQPISMKNNGSRDEAAGFGLLVKGVADGSPAEIAGVRSGDIIIGFNKNRLHDISQFKKMVEESNIGESAELDLVRDTRIENIRVFIGEAR